MGVCGRAPRALLIRAKHVGEHIFVAVNVKFRAGGGILAWARLGFGIGWFPPLSHLRFFLPSNAAALSKPEGLSSWVVAATFSPLISTFRLPGHVSVGGEILANNSSVVLKFAPFFFFLFNFHVNINCRRSGEKFITSFAAWGDSGQCFVSQHSGQISKTVSFLFFFFLAGKFVILFLPTLNLKTFRKVKTVRSGGFFFV